MKHVFVVGMSTFLFVSQYIVSVTLWKETLKIKVKVEYPRRGHEGPEEKESYSSTLSLTSALDRGEW
jgi:hypothetical protein